MLLCFTSWAVTRPILLWKNLQLFFLHTQLRKIIIRLCCLSPPFMEEIPTVLVLLKAAPCNQTQLILIQIRFYLRTFLIKKPKGNLLVQPFPAGDFGPRHDLVGTTANRSQNTEKKKKAEKRSYSLLCYL